MAKDKTSVSNGEVFDKLRKSEQQSEQIASVNMLNHRYAEKKEVDREWELNSFPVIHHSDAFSQAYKPSYRVIADELIPFLPLFTELDKRLAKGQVKVAIEGGSGSGKTTLCRMISDIYDCTVFHMDDFFCSPNNGQPNVLPNREEMLTESVFCRKCYSRWVKVNRSATVNLIVLP